MHPSTAAQHTCAMMRLGGLRGFLSAVLAVALVAPALDTAWTSRTPNVTSLVDPSLRAGEVALVHTRAGHAGALSTSLAQLGATDLETDAAADTVVAGLSPAALDAIRTDVRVTGATTDITAVASGGFRGNMGVEMERLTDAAVSRATTCGPSTCRGARRRPRAITGTCSRRSSRRRGSAASPPSSRSATTDPTRAR